MNRPGKSPPTAAPPRVAGEPIDRRLDDVVSGELLLSILALLTEVLAGLDWRRYATGAKPWAWLMRAVALGSCGCAAWRRRREL